MFKVSGRLSKLEPGVDNTHVQWLGPLLYWASTIFLGTDKKLCLCLFSDYLIDAPCVIIVFLLQYHIL